MTDKCAFERERKTKYEIRCGDQVVACHSMPHAAGVLRQLAPQTIPISRSSARSVLTQEHSRLRRQLAEHGITIVDLRPARRPRASTPTSPPTSSSGDLESATE